MSFFFREQEKIRMKQTFAWLFSILIIMIIMLSCSADGIDAQQTGAGSDDIVWHDGQQLTLEGKGWTDTESPYDRLPAKAKSIVREAIWNLSHHSAGMRIRFTSDAQFIKVSWTLIKEDLALPHMPATGVSGIDMYARDENGRWVFVANGRPTGLTNEAEFKLPESSEYALYLPLYNGVKQLDLGAYKTRKIEPSAIAAQGMKKPIVFYGTSITQGACASRPGLACTAIVGRRLDVPVVNLGFSGNGRMEPEMAQLLGELDPTIYVIDCLWNMTPEMISERAESFIDILRGLRPTTPIVLVEDASFRDQPTQDGDILRAIFEKLKTRGDGHLYFLPNAGMLGSDTEGTVDGCHPNDLGMMRQALVFDTFLRPLLLSQEK
jgi:hypothetical protein